MSQVDDLESKHVPKMFVVSDLRDTIAVWAYVEATGLAVVLEPSTEKAIDIDIPHHVRLRNLKTSESFQY